MDCLSKRDLARQVAFEFHQLSKSYFSEAHNISSNGDYARELFERACFYRACALRYEKVANSSWRSFLVPRVAIEGYASFLFLCGPTFIDSSFFSLE